MARRTLIIFSIFIGIAIISSLFIYWQQTRVEESLAQYVASITTCGNILNAEDCYARDFCEGIYQPSCPDCADAEFKECRKISETQAVQIQQTKNLCESTGGEWYRNQLGNFCLCDHNGMNKKFSKTEGCVSY